MTSKEIMDIIEKRFSPYLKESMCEDVKNMLIMGCIQILEKKNTSCLYNSPILTVYDYETHIKYKFKFIFDNNTLYVKELESIKPKVVYDLSEIYDIIYNHYHFDNDKTIESLKERFLCKGFTFINNGMDAINTRVDNSESLHQDDSHKIKIVLSFDIKKDNISYDFNIVYIDKSCKFVPISIVSDDINITLDEGEGVRLISDGISYTKLKIEYDSLACIYTDEKGISYDPKTIDNVYIAFKNGNVDMYKCYMYYNSTKLNELFIKYNCNGVDIDVSLNQLKDQADIFILDDCDDVLLSDILKGIQMVIEQEGDLKVDKVTIDKDHFQMIKKRKTHTLNNYKENLEKYKKERL